MVPAHKEGRFSKCQRIAGLGEKFASIHRFITVPAAKSWSVGQDLDRYHNRFLGGSIIGISKSCTSQTDLGMIPIAHALSPAICASSDVSHLCTACKDIFQKKGFLPLSHVSDICRMVDIGTYQPPGNYS